MSNTYIFSPTSKRVYRMCFAFFLICAAHFVVLNVIVEYNASSARMASFVMYVCAILLVAYEQSRPLWRRNMGFPTSVPQGMEPPDEFHLKLSELRQKIASAIPHSNCIFHIECVTDVEDNMKEYMQLVVRIPSDHRTKSFVFTEPIEDFPSDNLMVKLMLLFG